MSGNAIAIVGGGAWGTALAVSCRLAGHAVSLLCRDREVAAEIMTERRNRRYLGDISLPEGIDASVDAEDVLTNVHTVLCVVPAQTMRTVLSELRPHIDSEAKLILCAKGIERQSGCFMSEVASAIFPGQEVASLSGPSFAADVAKGLPTAVTIAARSPETAKKLAELLSGPTLRCYSTDDLIGVEAGGALKNVLAIAAGAVAGAELGASASAAMVTRGFVELRRIGTAIGGRPETFMGLSGLGDLILTCGSAQSRNFSYGIALGRGENLQNRPLAEGKASAGMAAKIAARHGVDAPIIEATAALIAGKLTVTEAVEQLFARPLKTETE